MQSNNPEYDAHYHDDEIWEGPICIYRSEFGSFVSMETAFQYDDLRDTVRLLEETITSAVAKRGPQNQRHSEGAVQLLEHHLAQAEYELWWLVAKESIIG